jgi:hypothetical protein
MNIKILLVGSVDLIVCGIFLLNQNFVEHYARHAPKAFIWRKLFGVDRTIWLMNRVFLPFGVLLGLFLLYVSFNQ